MQLAHSPTSPYVRRVEVAAIETGLDGRIERIAVDYHDESGDYARLNPLMKVPSLILDDGRVLIDSTAIAEYLDLLHDGPRLFLPPGEARVERMQLQMLIDGIQEAGTTCTGELVRRPAQYRWAAAAEKQLGKARRGFDRLEELAGALDGTPDYATICAAVLCGFFDFRLPSLDWRAGRPRLAAWYEGFAARPSMQATVPRLPAAQPA